jgi:lysophospholipase L1-like esterase
MRRSAAILALAALATVTAACGGGDDSGRDTTASTEARPSGYVAMGDSFSAGVGAPPYDAASGKCERSTLSWPKLLDAADDDLDLVAWPACGGAKIEHLLGPWDSRQLAAQVPADADLDVGLVTLTISGNDAGFSDLVGRCVLGDCSDVPGSADFQATLQAITDRLADELYPAIRDAFPNARIVHVGYPRLTPAPGEPLGSDCGWMNGAAEQEAVAGIVAALDDAIEAAVDQTATGDVTFVDDLDTFEGHELCTADPWVNEVVSFDSGRAHPTAAGYEALAATVADALDD